MSRFEESRRISSDRTSHFRDSFAFNTASTRQTIYLNFKATMSSKSFKEEHPLGKLQRETMMKLLLSADRRCDAKATDLFAKEGLIFVP
jgi:hypothetical protein